MCAMKHCRLCSVKLLVFSCSAMSCSAMGPPCMLRGLNSRKSSNIRESPPLLISDQTFCRIEGREGPLLTPARSSASACSCSRSRYIATCASLQHLSIRQ